MAGSRVQSSPRVQVVEVSPSDPVGRLGEWLTEAGITVEIATEARPLDGYAGLVVLGGPQSANDAELEPIRQQLRDAVTNELPTLGICLGAQLLAVAAGGEVAPGTAGPELGLGSVDVAVPDVLLDKGTLPVVQWHHDTVTRLPDGAALLASSEAYEVQAFRVGEVAWGMQFHVEATPEMVAEWAAYDDIDAAVVEPVRRADGELQAAGEPVVRRFAHVITG